MCGTKDMPWVYTLPTLLITWQNGSTGYCLCTQVDPSGPCNKREIILTACHFTPVYSVIKEVPRFHYILMFWKYFICKLGKGVRKVPSHSSKMRSVFFPAHVRMSFAYLPCPINAYWGDIYNILTCAGKNRSHFKTMRKDYTLCYMKIFSMMSHL